MISKKNMIMAFVGSLVLVGCGSDSKSDDSSPSTTESGTKMTKGYLVDSAVSGVTYSCAEVKGVTSSTGEFECPSTPVTFSIGSYEIGTLDSFTQDTKVYPQDLLGVPRSTFNNGEVTQLAQLLQSLDSDKNASNGIAISQETAEALTDAQENMTLEELATLAGVSVTNQEEAIAHLKEQIETAINSNGGDVDLDNIDLSQYSVIYTYKNASADIIESLKNTNKNNGSFTMSDELIECSSLRGYAPLPSGEGVVSDANFEVNVNIKIYAKVPSFTSFCTEVDYGESQNVGTNSASMLWNP